MPKNKSQLRLQAVSGNGWRRYAKPAEAASASRCPVSPTQHQSQCRGAWAQISLRRSSSSPSMYAVVDGLPSASRTMRRIASSSRSSKSTVSMSRVRALLNLSVSAQRRERCRSLVEQRVYVCGAWRPPGLLTGRGQLPA
jgi:hypothetical protein